MPQRFPPAHALPVLAALGALTLGALAGAQHTAPSAPAQTQTAQNQTAQTRPSPLRLLSGTVVAVPPGIRETAAFLVLSNPTDQPVVLKAASTSAAAHAMLMVTTKSGGMSGMKAAPTLTVPAHGTLNMGHMGDHVMLMNLKRPLTVGKTLVITLTDTEGRTLKATATVRKP